MVLRNRIRLLSGAVIFLSIVILFSCEDLKHLVDCSKCKTDEPSTADIRVKVSTGFYDPVVINIYEGFLEDSILFKSVITTSPGVTINLPLNKTYTISAGYMTTAGHSYNVINSLTPRVRYVADQCNEPCYMIYDDVINLKLKL